DAKASAEEEAGEDGAGPWRGVKEAEAGRSDVEEIARVNREQCGRRPEEGGAKVEHHKGEDYGLGANEADAGHDGGKRNPADFSGSQGPNDQRHRGDHREPGGGIEGVAPAGRSEGENQTGG